jgi:hypothetical protein
VGGIFWLDWHELQAAQSSNRLRQIVGHTPLPRGPQQAGDRLWCIDVGAALSGKVCAVLREGADGEWQPIVQHGQGIVT